MLCHNHLWSMWCYNSYWLIFDTVIASKSVQKIMIDTYIRFHFTHTDLQISIHVNIKSLNSEFSTSIYLLILTHGYFSYRCLRPMPILSLYYFINICEYTSSTLDVLESMLLLLHMCVNICHSYPPSGMESSYIVNELDLVPTGLLRNNIITCCHLIWHI